MSFSISLPCQRGDTSHRRDAVPALNLCCQSLQTVTPEIPLLVWHFSGVFCISQGLNQLFWSYVIIKVSTGLHIFHRLFVIEQLKGRCAWHRAACTMFPPSPSSTVQFCLFVMSYLGFDFRVFWWILKSRRQAGASSRNIQDNPKPDFLLLKFWVRLGIFWSVLSLNLNFRDKHNFRVLTYKSFPNARFFRTNWIKALRLFTWGDIWKQAFVCGILYKWTKCPQTESTFYKNDHLLVLSR